MDPDTEIDTNSSIIILNPSSAKSGITLKKAINDGEIINIINISSFEIEFDGNESTSNLKKTSDSNYNTLLANSAMQCIWYDNNIDIDCWFPIIGPK